MASNVLFEVLILSISMLPNPQPCSHLNLTLYTRNIVSPNGHVVHQIQKSNLVAMGSFSLKRLFACEVKLHLFRMKEHLYLVIMRWLDLRIRFWLFFLPTCT